MGDIGRGRSGSAAWEGLLCTLSLDFLLINLDFGAKLRPLVGDLLYDLHNLPFRTMFFGLVTSRSEVATFCRFSGDYLDGSKGRTERASVHFFWFSVARF